MKRLMFLVMMMSLSNLANARFSGNGSGSNSDPYQITNADQLFEVRNELSACYKVMNEIDLGAWIEEDNPKQGWNPIGSSAPFTGTFDGNFKVIKGLRSNIGGLFKSVNGGTIKNTVLLNSNTQDGSLVGILKGNSSILNNVVVGGSCTGWYVGGLVSQVYSTYLDKISIRGNHVSLNIFTTEGYGNYEGVFGRAGGIVGFVDMEADNYVDVVSVFVCNNCFDGNIIGIGTTIRNEREGAGIVGNLVAGSDYYYIGNSRKDFFNSAEVKNNIAKGTAKYGIVWLQTQIWRNTICDNVCLMDTISEYRVANVLTYSNNYAWTNTVGYKDGSEVELPDDGYNGASFGTKTLKRQTTYEGIGFDFKTQWKIQEGSSFPYCCCMSDPCTITSFKGGSKAMIKGTANGIGKAYVFVNGNMYETNVLDNQWEVSLGNVSEGTKAQVCVAVDGKAPSMFSTAVATNTTVTDKKLGDANGDGEVDVSDVVSIINYLVGKSSPSFSPTNADVNEDGNVLVDDAVGTVQRIIDNQ